ncbi:MAG: chorismate mutase [Calditrichaeota bacterium]|nr:chorismate mutase [Calditrichota bacterium]TDI88079.1 MAG: chorismate mutase [Caldithrix sp.]
MDIDDWRRKIDDVDKEILKLLNLRAAYSIRIGDIKRRDGEPIYSPEREVQIIARVVRENAGPLTAGGVRRIFERLIDESRKVEKDVTKGNKERSE